MSGYGFPFPKSTRLPHEIYANHQHVFHLAFRAMAETAPFDGRVGAETWALVERAAAGSEVCILPACLMPDHLHVVARPGDLSLIRWVNSFKSYSTRVAWGIRRGVLWQPGFYDRLLRDEAELEAAIHYVLANPGEGGLALAWPWAFERRDRAGA